MPSFDLGGEVESIAYFGDVGPLPEDDPAGAAVALLEANLFLSEPASPTFCCNPESGHVLLVGRVPLEGVDADAVMQLLANVAAFAREWRAEDTGPPTQPGDRAMSGAAHLLSRRKGRT